MVPQAELDSMLVAMRAEDAAFVRVWFVLDEQAVPPMYQLRPTFEADEAKGESWWGQKEDLAKGQKALPSIFHRLQAILREASKVLEEPSRRKLYEISVTHDEVLNGLLDQSEEQKAKCFFFSRPIKSPPKPEDKMAGKFYDVIEKKEFDQDASSRLEELRREVCHTLLSVLSIFGCCLDDASFRLSCGCLSLYHYVCC